MLEFTHPRGEVVLRSSFHPEVEDIFIRIPDMENYTQLARDSYQLQPQEATMSTPYGSTTFIGRRQRSLNASAVVEVNLRSVTAGHGGLAVYKDSLRHTKIFFDASKKQLEFNIESLGHNRNEIKRNPPVDLRHGHGDVLLLRIDADSDHYVFRWSTRDLKESHRG
jgi:hypothetical protein